RWAGSIAAAEPEVTVELDLANALVRVTVQNPTAGTITVNVTTPMTALRGQERSFSAPPGQTTVALATSANWYDYAFANAAGGAWSRKLAGHLEGASSQTRPQ